MLSRFSIARSQSWLAKSSLTNCGYEGVFARDLFEAQVQMPNTTTPLHVFTTHLKCCSDSASVQRRAAAARAISNFFVTVFLPTNSAHVFTLSGDLNEDIDPPSSGSGRPIQALTGSGTGLRLTTPLNPSTNQKLTWSIRSLPLTVRFDYVLPCELLASNVIASQVFRSDLVANPPAPPQARDGFTASDHLPVVVQFNCPDPALRITATRSSQALELKWPSLVGRKFNVECSDDLARWTLVSSSVTATSTNSSISVARRSGEAFFRVVRLP